MNVLISPRLTLRPPAPPDAEDIALWLSDRNVARMLARVPHPYHVEDAEEWIDRVATDPTCGRSARPVSVPPPKSRQ